MQTKQIYNKKPKTLKEAAMSIPNTIKSAQIFNSEETSSYRFSNMDTGIELMSVINRQHPLINLWFLSSSISLVVLFLFLSVFQ